MILFTAINPYMDLMKNNYFLMIFMIMIYQYLTFDFLQGEWTRLKTRKRAFFKLYIRNLKSLMPCFCTMVFVFTIRSFVLLSLRFETSMLTRYVFHIQEVLLIFAMICACLPLILAVQKQKVRGVVYVLLMVFMTLIGLSLQGNDTTYGLSLSSIYLYSTFQDSSAFPFYLLNIILNAGVMYSVGSYYFARRYEI